MCPFFGADQNLDIGFYWLAVLLPLFPLCCDSQFTRLLLACSFDRAHERKNGSFSWLNWDIFSLYFITFLHYIRTVHYRGQRYMHFHASHDRNSLYIVLLKYKKETNVDRHVVNRNWNSDSYQHKPSTHKKVKTTQFLNGEVVNLSLSLLILGKFNYANFLHLTGVIHSKAQFLATIDH